MNVARVIPASFSRVLDLLRRGASRLVLAAVAAAAVTSAGARHAAAAFVTPSDWVRPSSDAGATASLTTYQEWNSFTSPAGPNDPDVAEVNPNAGTGPNPSKANLYDTSGASFVPGSGNIYSPSAATLLDADVPSFGLGATHTTAVLFQVRTLGSELDYDSVRLTYNDGTANRTITYDGDREELARAALGGFGGSQVDSLFRFEVPFSPATFKIEFDAAGSSMSTDRVAVDTFTAAVPEPASLGVAAAAGLLLVRRRRRPSPVTPA